MLNMHSQWGEWECSNRWQGWTKPKKVKKHWSIGPKVNGQQNLTGFVKFFHQYLCWYGSYQRCENVLSTLFKLPYSSLKKVSFYELLH